MAGFANGVCEYDGDAREREDPPYGFIVEYASECTVQESNGPNGDGVVTPHLDPDTPRPAGNCDIDVDECDSSPCQNGATCTESSVEAEVSFHAYQCTCVAGFANGVCEYSNIEQYDDACAVLESTASINLSGNCDMDVDECASQPCQNSGACIEESVDAYRCTCADGFAGDNCNDDVNECDPNPCENGGVCFDSSDGLLASVSWQTAVTIVRDSPVLAYDGAFWRATSPLYDNGNAVSHAFYSTPVNRIRITVDGQKRTFDMDGNTRTLRELVNAVSTQSVASGDR